jgi:hypothetical protein
LAFFSFAFLSVSGNFQHKKKKNSWAIMKKRLRIFLNFFWGGGEISKKILSPHFFFLFLDHSTSPNFSFKQVFTVILLLFWPLYAFFGDFYIFSSHSSKFLPASKKVTTTCVFIYPIRIFWVHYDVDRVQIDRYMTTSTFLLNTLSCFYCALLH